MYFLTQGLGATVTSVPASATAAVSRAVDKINSFAAVAKAEAERVFEATTLGLSSDQFRRDAVIRAAEGARDAAIARSSTGVPAFIVDPAKAKAGIDAAMTRAAQRLPEIKDIANVAQVQTAANSAKTAIDEAVSAVVKGSAPRSGSSSPAPALPLPGATPGYGTGSDSGGSKMPSPAVILLVVAAALFLIPGKKRSNPSSLVKTRTDEQLWRRAKAAARRQGRADYAYIVGTFKRMQANKALSQM